MHTHTNLLLLAIVLSTAAHAATSLSGPIWYLRAFRPASGSPTVVAAQDRENYCVAFQFNAVAAIQVDCNKCTAGYDTADAGLHINSPLCSRMYCGAASLDTRFISALTGATSYRLVGDTTLLILHGTGPDTLHFAALPSSETAPKQFAAGRQQRARLDGQLPMVIHWHDGRPELPNPPAFDLHGALRQPGASPSASVTITLSPRKSLSPR